MFEKSLYDLIRGLRQHKGVEKEYILNNIRECRKEIKSADMDLKATALLKLTYLEMFGHDMSWASFNVLEVMSSQKYPQKKVGYLAAVQSFRPDTEVLMLAENLLKKDLTSPSIPTIGLPLQAIPHVVNPSMANSLLAELLPRLTHSSPTIRKKTVVSLYRLALVFPETLRPAWPKMKERLWDEAEDSSVTAATVNVVCELGWRRPRDFLPLAPRLFDLLVQGQNNWMAIKIIKLFAHLTPLEPRLVKKLLPPLTSLIKTTPAMSLLYECINGIIQGGILQSSEGTFEGDEIARLCVGKLRSMLCMDGDPNLKYVALLAFNKIVSSHPNLVSDHQDVIFECVDDPDISIRQRALDLVVGMVNSENLMMIVGQLMRQLRNAPAASDAHDPSNDRGMHEGVVPVADSDDDDMEESLNRPERKSTEMPSLPTDYRNHLIRQILFICSRNTYQNITDFEWYIDVLIQLVRHVPGGQVGLDVNTMYAPTNDAALGERSVSYDIGAELQNIAVRVQSVRPEATRAAESLLLADQTDKTSSTSGRATAGVLKFAVWIAGEYSQFLAEPDSVLTALLHPSTSQFPVSILVMYLQAIPKIFSSVSKIQSAPWSAQRKTTTSLLLARITHYLEPLTTHPDLEVQERAVEYLELMRLAAEAVQQQVTEQEDGGYVEPPLLLTEAIPSLFRGLELNPVSAAAQHKISPPTDLDLDEPINDNLPLILQQAELDFQADLGQDEAFQYYFQAPLERSSKSSAAPAADRLKEEAEMPSYQKSAAEEEYLDPDILSRRRAERREQYRYDPFYIDPERRSGTSTPLHNILKTSNGDDLDVDSIPVMELNLDENGNGVSSSEDSPAKKMTTTVSRTPPKRREPFTILSDETVPDSDQPSGTLHTERGSSSLLARSMPSRTRPQMRRDNQSRGSRPGLLQVDSSGLGSLSLEGGGDSQLDIERREQEEAEMRAAVQEVERLRLEMQRAQERIKGGEADGEGQVVKRRGRKKKKRDDTPPVQQPVAGEGPKETENGSEVAVAKKKKKKKAIAEEGGRAEADGSVLGDAAAPKVKKKRRQVNLDVDDGVNQA